LTLSLVATIDGAVVGHLAFSPVTLDGRDEAWYGLAPVSGWPQRQRCGIGSALIPDGLARLRAQGTRGCVVLGDTLYYRHFGFAPHSPLPRTS
jgi:putative acetyltransferase